MCPMQTWDYEAMDNHGYPTFGTVQAASEAEAVAEIRKLGLWTTWVRPKNSLPPAVARPRVRLSRWWLAALVAALGISAAIVLNIGISRHYLLVATVAVVLVWAIIADLASRRRVPREDLQDGRPLEPTQNER